MTQLESHGASSLVALLLALGHALAATKCKGGKEERSMSEVRKNKERLISSSKKKKVVIRSFITGFSKERYLNPGTDNTRTKTKNPSFGKTTSSAATLQTAGQWPLQVVGSERLWLRHRSSGCSASLILHKQKGRKKRSVKLAQCDFGSGKSTLPADTLIPGQGQPDGPQKPKGICEIFTPQGTGL